MLRNPNLNGREYFNNIRFRKYRGLKNKMNGLKVYKQQLKKKVIPSIKMSNPY